MPAACGDSWRESPAHDAADSGESAAPSALTLLWRAWWRSLRTGCARTSSGSDLGSNHVTGNDHLHPAIQFSARRSSVVCDGTRLAEAACNHVIDRDMGIDQIVTH